VIDQTVVDVADNPIGKLTETVVGTNRLLADENHRLVATRLCWSDHPQASRLRQALANSGVQNVEVLSESQAATALAREAQGRPGSAVLVVGDETAMLSVVGAEDAPPTVLAAQPLADSDPTGAVDTLLGRLYAEHGAAGDVYLMGTSADLTNVADQLRTRSSLRVEVPEDPTFALARGAAMAAETSPMTTRAPAAGDMRSSGQVGAQLAYSMAGDSERLPMDSLTGPEDDDDADTGPLPPLGSRRLAATELVLGVAVAGSVARLALAGPAAGSYTAIHHLVIELPMHPFETLIRTVTGTQQALAGDNRQLVATRLYWSDQPQAEALRQALADSGVPEVAVVSEAQAVTAVLRSILGARALPGSVALLITAEAATLWALGAAEALATVLAAVPLEEGLDAAAAAVDMVLEWLRSASFAVAAAYVMGTSALLTEVVEELRARSSLRVELIRDPEFAIASGAAMAPAAALAGDATAMAPAAGMVDSNAEEPQLAYSMADDGELLPVEGVDESVADYYGDEAEAGHLRLSARSVLIKNAVIAFTVIGFASLAVAVAIAIRPAAAQQPVVGHQNAQPGKFMPLLPTQQQAPVPAPPVDAPNAGFQGGVIPDSNGYIPPQLAPGGGGTGPVAPAPQSPGVPGFVPNPNGPIPIPIIIPFPGWRPPYPGWQPPYPGWQPIGPTTTFPTPTTPPTTPPTTAPTTVPTTPPTTAPTTVPTTPPSTAPTTPPTTLAPQTTTAAPTTAAPKPTTAAPTTAAPTTAAPTTVAPKPTQQPTQQTLAPKPPVQQPQQTVVPKPPIVTPHH